MTLQPDFTAATAPVITPDGVTDTITKLAPFAFESGMNVTLCAKFPEFMEKIIFTLEFTNEHQSATDAEPFLAAVRANEDRLATRLAEARYNARTTQLEVAVSLDGIDMDPTWPRLLLHASPYNPNEDTEDEDS